jgi:hypothetical protein
MGSPLYRYSDAKVAYVSVLTNEITRKQHVCD